MSCLQSTKISDLAQVRSGGGAPQNPSAFSDDGHPFVRAGSLSRLLNGDDESQLEKILPQVARDHRLQLFPKGTVLFAKSGMSATKGYIYDLKQPAYVVNHLAALIPYEPEDSAFLTRALQRFSPTCLIKDQAYPSIRLGDIEQMEVLAPNSIVERSRIAAILDKADDLRRKRKRALELLDGLTQSIFLEMFGDPVSNPRKLPKIALGDLIKVKSGNGLVAKDMNPKGVFPVYGGNGINGYHDEFMFESPELVIGRVGVYCGAVHLTEPKSWITDNALYISEYKKPISKLYLKNALTEANLNQYAGRAAQPLVSGSRIYPVEILLPSKEDQARFEIAIKQLSDLEKSYGASDNLVDITFSSLQSRAFSGQL